MNRFHIMAQNAFLEDILSLLCNLMKTPAGLASLLEKLEHEAIIVPAESTNICDDFDSVLGEVQNKLLKEQLAQTDGLAFLLALNNAEAEALTLKAIINVKLGLSEKILFGENRTQSVPVHDIPSPVLALLSDISQDLEFVNVDSPPADERVGEDDLKSLIGYFLMRLGVVDSDLSQNSRYSTAGSTEQWGAWDADCCEDVEVVFEESNILEHDVNDMIAPFSNIIDLMRVYHREGDAIYVKDGMSETVGEITSAPTTVSQEILSKDSLFHIIGTAISDLERLGSENEAKLLTCALNKARNFSAVCDETHVEHRCENCSEMEVELPNFLYRCQKEAMFHEELLQDAFREFFELRETISQFNQEQELLEENLEELLAEVCSERSAHASDAANERRNAAQCIEVIIEHAGWIGDQASGEKIIGVRLNELLEWLECAEITIYKLSECLIGRNSQDSAVQCDIRPIEVRPDAAERQLNAERLKSAKLEIELANSRVQVRELLIKAEKDAQARQTAEQRVQRLENMLESRKSDSLAFLDELLVAE